MTRMNTEICWRSSVLTALIIYPQMLDRCHTDFHLFQICLTSVDYLFHTDGHGWMSASGRGGYCLSSELRRNVDGSPLAAQLLN